jgi:dihydrofolate synthase/folylpolyglutamate synthase
MDQPGSLNSGHASLVDWLTWLETLSPTEIDLGLDRVLEVLDRLQVARPDRVIHVAGTNGKGSSVAMLEALFLKLRGSVGSYTSPHVSRYNERIRINGEPVSDVQIIAAFERVEAVRQSVPLTYFEYGTLAAIVIFESSQVDTAILEVGMGGRLDAVNAIEPDAGIITNVSLDHCDWLGEDIESIAVEKAGILRGDKPFVFGAADVPDSILVSAEDLGADLLLGGRDFEYSKDADHNNTWSWSGRRLKLTGLEMPALSGNIQLQNAAAVLALVEALQLDELLDRELLNGAFGGLELAGRCQTIRTDRNWLLDVAHNAEAASVLSDHLADMDTSARTIAIIGMLRDKDLSGIVSPLLERVDSWIAVSADAARSLPGRELAAGIAEISDKPCLIADSLADAMEHARAQTTVKDLILVTGSFYVVGPALAWLKGNA